MTARRCVSLRVSGASAGLRLLCVLLSSLLVLQALAAQVDSSPKLRIQILDGDGAINKVGQRVAREPIVQVEDENSRPVAGAVVTFALPDRGASGVFANGSTTATSLTDQRGQAIARGLRANKVPGKFDIRVNASHQGMRGAATLAQTNILAAAVAGIPLAKLIAILLIGGGAAAGGAIAGTRGGGGPGGGTGNTTGPPPAPTTVSPGAGAVGPPR